jgi:hypothetical protein
MLARDPKWTSDEKPLNFQTLLLRKKERRQALTLLQTCSLLHPAHHRHLRNLSGGTNVWAIQGEDVPAPTNRRAITQNNKDRETVDTLLDALKKSSAYEDTNHEVTPPWSCSNCQKLNGGKRKDCFLCGIERSCR